MYTLLLLVGLLATDLSGVSSSNTTDGRISEDIGKLAVAKAAGYFLKQKDHGWGTFTPRAVIALTFANRVSPVEGLDLIKKDLNVQLLLELMENQNRMSPSSLSMYINALYATCQDPRNFQGVDLVSRLRSDINLTVSNSSIPLAFLTLCLAGELHESDARMLKIMYDMEEFRRTGSRALIMMAMICYTSSKRDEFRSYREKFFLNSPEVTDIYSKALFLQASISVRHHVPVDELVKQQLPDGSFGDMLATYYAIPVLMRSSLLDIKCSKNDTGMESIPMTGEGANHVTYSLWVSAGTGVTSHSSTITFNGDKKFSDIMKMAAARDPLYRFQYDNVHNKTIVYKIAGIPNDAERMTSWKLYANFNDKVVPSALKNLRMLPLAVNEISAKDYDHFVFYFSRDL